MRSSTITAAIVVALLLAGCQNGAQRVGSYVPASGALGDVTGATGSASERVIHSFQGQPNGELPETNPILDASGQLYGPADRGGVGTGCSGGCGTIYRLTLTGGRWIEKTLYSFDLIHGAYPDYALVADALGNLYGATQVGGSLGVAYGLVATPSGLQYRVLHNFRGGRDGAQPRASLVFDSHGDLYGTTVGGGTGGSGGNGTVYRLTPGSGGAWSETIVHRFSPAQDGTSPQGPVYLASDGSIYGTTSYGGNTACAAGCGVVYKLTPSGSGQYTASVVHAFDGADGDTSIGGLVPDARGNLFGTTDEGAKAGCFGGCGVVFELQRQKSGGWKFAVIHYFRVDAGGGPEGNIVFDAAGNLYGSTVVGGDLAACPQQRGCGVVYKLARGVHGGWTYTVLHVFTNSPDGALATGVVLAKNGRLYGSTIGGGTLGLGAIFEVKP